MKSLHVIETKDTNLDESLNEELIQIDKLNEATIGSINTLGSASINSIKSLFQESFKEKIELVKNIEILVNELEKKKLITNYKLAVEKEEIISQAYSGYNFFLFFKNLNPTNDEKNEIIKLSEKYLKKGKNTKVIFNSPEKIPNMFKTRFMCMIYTELPNKEVELMM